MSDTPRHGEIAIKTRYLKPAVSPLGLGVTAVVLMAVRLLVPTPVGMADNNDGSRLLCLVGADARVVHNATVPF